MSKQLLHVPSEFEMFLDCIQAQRYGGFTIPGLIETVDRRFAAEDEEYALNQRIQAHNRTIDAHLGAVEDEPGNEHGSHLLEDDEDVWADENAREPEAERARRLR